MNLETQEKVQSQTSYKPIDEEIMIPKKRFDEINRKYINARECVSVLESEIKIKDERITELKTMVKEVESKYANEKALLDIKEIFVDGGFKKEEYEGIVRRISCPTKEDAIELAKEIVKIKNNN